MNINKDIFGAIMVYVGATIILLFAVLPYVTSSTPLPAIVTPIIVAFSLFCYVYVTMCLSLMKVHKKVQGVVAYEQ